MKKWSLAVTAAIFSLLLASCQKPTENQPQVKIEDLHIDPSFNWETQHSVTFTLTSDFATVVTISSENGNVLYHKGLYSILPDSYVVLINLPTAIEKVRVNGTLVDVLNEHIELSLNQENQQKAVIEKSASSIEGLIAAWSFDENSGSVAYDQLGVNNGTITGYTWSSGIRHSGLIFDGLGGHVQVPKTTILNPTGDKISFSMWFKLDHIGASGTLIYQNVKYILKMDAQGRLTFALYAPTYVDAVMAYSDRILDTDWHHMAATYDGSIMKLYLDGVLKATEINAGTLHTSTSDVYIGNQNTINHFNGSMDEVALYSHSLTETEVIALYTTTPSPDNGEGSLVAYWNLNENSGTLAADYQGTHPGTITQAVWASGVSGSCLSFNGAAGNVKVLNAGDLNPVQNITMMVWAKTVENKTAKIFQKGDWDGHGIGQGKWDGWNVHVRTSDNISHTLHWGSGLPMMNEWYHLALTYDGTSLKMYVNGQLKNSISLTGTLKINTRDLSIGSDNNAQKYFNGSSDEPKFFCEALNATEIQANYTQTGQPEDQDGDGVADNQDDYPSDPARAFANFSPAAGYGSLAFEDLWPGRGDYDFNDLVTDYQFTLVTNSANKVTEVTGTFVVRAIGAGFSNGFGFQLPGTILLSSDIQVDGTILNENYIQLNANGTEAGQEKITVILFDNINAIMPPASGFGVNVIPGEPYTEPDTLQISLIFTPGKYSISDLQIDQFNPFLIVNKERGKEVHLPDYPPTSLVDATYFGTAQDNSDPENGRTYKTSENLPWALKIASSYAYTIESSQITSAHLRFGDWAESSGSLYPDWYLDLSGYRDNSHIYQVTAP